VIETLDNPSQALLLYIAGELPDEDRAQVERRLASDPSFAAELDALRSAGDRIEEGLARLDAVAGLAVSTDTMSRRVGREIRQRLAGPRVPAAPREVARSSQLRRWAIPAAAAAAVLVGLVFWLNRGSPSPSPTVADKGLTGGQTEPAAPRQLAQADENLALLENSITSSATALADVDRGAKNEAALRRDEVSEYLLNLSSSQQ